MDIFGATAHTTWLNGRVGLNGTGVSTVRVGSTNLSERKWLVVQNASKVPIYIGSETEQGTAITRALLTKRGIKVAAGDMIWLPVSDSITVKATLHTDGSTNSGLLRVSELA